MNTYYGQLAFNEINQGEAFALDEQPVVSKEYTKKLDKRLKDQITKLSGWSEGKFLNELYPAKIYVQCAEDVEGAGDVSYSLHDNEHDFDLSNNLKHEIIEEKNGEIENVEILKVSTLNPENLPPQPLFSSS